MLCMCNQPGIEHECFRICICRPAGCQHAAFQLPVTAHIFRQHGFRVRLYKPIPGTATYLDGLQTKRTGSNWHALWWLWAPGTRRWGYHCWVLRNKLSNQWYAFQLFLNHCLVYLNHCFSFFQISPRGLRKKSFSLI